ncbi:putative polyketide synthase [Lentithecium fluviatile CBS 122367]|uniref:Putative polyketide synthase n=1 Tax=Lentithecium fluviatile CBS 122367 TaxID=1168545 RepID=A0A6G1JJC9_9PLEO|nr:putative polyketide synthase [Lentithecium fluviatile CBS 122367]
MDYSTASSSASCSDSSRSPSVSSASSGFSHTEQTRTATGDIPMVEPIAIIGFSLKGPGDADTVESFWEMMMEARSTASEFPKERLNHAAHHSTDTGAMGTIRPQRAHFLKEDLAVFDASFFGMTAAEAAAMDPQQRGLLEASYRALENAGLPMDRVYGTETSVHTGCFTADYMMVMGKDPELTPKFFATGVAAAMLSNRISSFYNLRGPSATIDTACSSSLVALDQACQSLRLGQSSMGIVAGCNLIFSLDLTIGLSNMGFLSPDGICHSFDHKANGYSRGEGFGVVIVKRLSDAVRDGDTIRAVIRATGTNQDGDTPLAKPSKFAQAKLISDTYRRAGLDRSKTKYVEAHGTGTSVGDPLEAAAIGTSFSAGRSKAEAVYVSSLKANFGHLEGAAGIAGLIKTCLVLERGIIPPVAGLERVNPEIDVDFLNIKFPLQPTPWPSRGLRRASVNSFGFGGTNAHVVLDDAYHYMQRYGISGKHCTRIIPPFSLELKTNSRRASGLFNTINVSRISKPLVLAWSTQDELSLQQLISDYTKWLYEAEYTYKHVDIRASLAHTLLERRSLHSWRSFAVTNPMDPLDSLEISRPVASQPPSELSLAFVFTGQGAQWRGMGRELFVYEIFRKSILDAICYLMGLGCYWHFVGAFTGELEPAARLDEPGFAQPLCTILQVALVELLASINVRPSVVIGHSSGEIAAAFASGAISRESAWKLAYYRGICSNKVASMTNIHGGMLAVGLSEEKTRGYIDHINAELGPGDLTIACVNSPSSVTVSGNKEHIDALATQLEHASVFARVLKVPVAYHGPHMENVADQYLDLIGEIEPGTMSLRHHVNMVSSVVGEPVDKGSLCEPSYWVQNLVSQVKFAQAVHATFASPQRKLSNKLDLSHLDVLWATDILEIGPHGALGGPIRDTLRPLSHGKDITYAPALVRKKDACVSLLTAVGQLHCRGYEVQLTQLNATIEDKLNSPIVLPNLPQYPFNHSKAFWSESRISKGMRFRKHGRNPFLGTPVADWNPLDARWRHFLKPADSSWISDHIINDKNLFPAAGMLTMVIEAAAQLAGDTAVLAFEICDATFHSALDLPADTDGVEVQLQLVAHDNLSLKHGAKYDWFLRTYQGGWADVCRGTVRVVPASDSVNEVDNGNEETHFGTRARAHFDDISSRCTREVDGAEIYDHFWKCGYHFGPSFKRIQSSKHSPSGEATAKIAMLAGQDSENPKVIHPATLDGVLQIVLPVITQIGNDSQHATSLPTRINRIWISKSGLLYEDAESVDVAVNIRKNGFRNTTSDIAVLSQDRSLRLFVERIETTLITDGLEGSQDPEAASPPLCWNVALKPELDCLDPERLDAILMQDTPRRAASRHYKSDLDRVLYYFIKKANDKLTASRVPQHGHLQRYYQWMQHQLSENASTLSAHDDKSFQRLYHDVKSRHPKHAKIYYRAGEHLVNLLSRRSDPLSLLFQGTDMSNFYECLLELSDFMVPVARYLDLLTHQNPDISVLEVGAGTGGATKHLMKSLTQRGSNGNTARYSRYCFTDISASFFAQAQADLAAFPKLDYKTLDLEQDPLSQDFEPESFDVIVASLVLHATADIDRTLAYLHTLLKPGGKLIAIEVAAPDQVSAGFIFGLLPGWWLSTDEYRKDRLSPCLSPDEWDCTLARNGFSGVDHIFWDTPDEEHHLNSLWISTRLEADKPPADRAFLTAALFAAKESDEVHMRLCQEHLEDLGVPLRYTNIGTLAVDNLDDTLVIVYDTPCNPILNNLDRDDFESFRATLTHATNVLWVSPASGYHTNPSSGAIYGLARTLRSENASLSFTILEADTSSELEDQASNLERVITQCLLHSSNHCESEYIEKNGMLHTRRIIEDAQLNEMITENDKSMIERDVRFGDANLRLTVETPGLLDSLYFTEASALSSDLAPNDVEVRVKAVGVNFKDCLVALGRVSDDTLGTECAGIVERVGDWCRLKIGDRVIVSALDTYRSVVRCNEALVARIPDNVPFTEAAKLPTNYVTAYHALVELGHISEGESVLIHAGAGGTGQAAIQLAQHFNAEVFATVGSQSKKDLLMSTYAIPEDHIFYSRDTSFSQGIKRATGGRGVDLVLNSLAGEELRASWECVAPYGRFLEIGKKDIFSHEKLPMFQFAQNVTFSAIDIAAMSKERPQLIQKSLKAVVDLLAQKKVRVASPLKIFSVHEVEDAFRYLQSGLNAGGVAVEIDQDAVVPAHISPDRGPCFSPNATYVIAGGLGGQGKSITRWMGKKGARNILLLSRKGMRTEGAMDFFEEMTGAGVYIEAPACDIASEAALRRTLTSASQRMPPIKGCIQAAMAIGDALFDTMTHDQWTSALNPKIHGSWNLHSLLPSDLDFFIMLSSISGMIGSSGQASYCTGNTYQDGLAAYRVAQGQKAVSLDLSAMADEGYFTNHQDDLEQYNQIKKIVLMGQKDLFTILEHYCNPGLSVENMQSQVAMGFQLPADVKSRGEELTAWMERPLFSNLHQLASTNSSSYSLSTQAQPQSQTDLSSLATSKSRSEGTTIITSAIRDKLARVLSRPAEDIDVTKPMHAHGVDSLFAVEFRNWFMKSLKVDVPIFEILGGGAIEALGGSVAEKLGIGE